MSAEIVTNVIHELVVVDPQRTEITTTLEWPGYHTITDIRAVRTAVLAIGTRRKHILSAARTAVIKALIEAIRRDCVTLNTGAPVYHLPGHPVVVNVRHRRS